MALRGSAFRMGPTSANRSTSFSTPTTATWIRGRVETRRALPSLVTTTSVPVSATATLAPVMPMSAARNFCRSSRRATATSAGMSAASSSLTSLREDPGHLLLRHVDGGHHHVRGALAGQLDDPLAQVGLRHLDALLLEEGVEVHLLGGHRLRLGDALDPVLLAEPGQVLLHLGGVGGPEDLGPGLGGLLLELLGQLVEVGRGPPLQAPPAGRAGPRSRCPRRPGPGRRRRPR